MKISKHSKTDNQKLNLKQQVATSVGGSSAFLFSQNTPLLINSIIQSTIDVLLFNETKLSLYNMVDD